MVGRTENPLEKKPFPSRKSLEGLVLVNDGPDPRKPGGGDSEELVVVGLGMEDVDPILAEPSRETPDPEGIDPLGGEEREQFNGGSGFTRLLSQNTQRAEADKRGTDIVGQMTLNREEEILSPTHGHGDKRVDDPESPGLPPVRYHWIPKMMIPFGFSGLSGSQVTLS
jgi:hypothetical protein